MKRKIEYLIITLYCISVSLNAQVVRDQDLVTLKNGYQLLGYVVEQYPGKLIKVYRPEEKDTSEVALSDISKLTKIWVQPFSPKQIQTEKGDTLPVVPGRFNNKKYVFRAEYNMHFRDIERRERRGLGISVLRNIKNRYMTGFTAIFFGTQHVNPIYAGFDANNSFHTFRQTQILFTNYLRIGKKVQNGRFSTLLGLHTGWVIDGSESSYNGINNPLSMNYEEVQGGWVLSSGIQFRINPDNQSGIAIEPGYTLIPQNIRQYSQNAGNTASIYLGFRRQVNHLFSLKLSYFF